MTTRTQTKVVCECGHEGFEVFRENDQPFSGLWEEYSLQGFEGGTVQYTSFADRPKDILAALAPKCPSCGQTGQVKYAKT